MRNLGKNLSIGNLCTYKICDPTSVINYSPESYQYFMQGKDHHSSLYSIIKLDFVNLLSSDENQMNGNMWVIQASISNISDHFIRYLVSHVNSDNFDIKSGHAIHPDTVKYGVYSEYTIFDFQDSDEPQLLNLNSDGVKLLNHYNLSHIH